MTKLKTALIIVILFSVSHVHGQNYIYKGSQQYPSTSTWSFPTSILGIPENVEIIVAKTKTGGYLMLNADVSWKEESISGTVTLILENGKLITVSQRVVSDHVDSKSKVLYTLSITNFSLLKEHNIAKIRFSIYNSLSKERNSYTASNKRSKSFDEPAYVEAKYKTATEIASLSD